MSNKIKKNNNRAKSKPRTAGADISQLNTQALQYHKQGNYEKALAICLQAIRMMPQIGEIWLDAAINYLKLERWDQALEYANKAQHKGVKTFRLYDTLSDLYGKKKQWDKVKETGIQALNIRNEVFSKDVGALPAINLPPKPSAETRQNNIIAFALFGGLAKYCETAILNAKEQKTIYPFWTCRFYIDKTVPDQIIEKLKQEGAEIIYVTEEEKSLPGPMWRFLALNDKTAHRVLLRDADSVISTREAKAVDEWIESGKYFHGMRDASTHTELILAGMWGCIPKALPDVASMLKEYSKEITNQHFADQYFLRQYIWPYFKQSLIQHDSMFGFLDAKLFPDKVRPTGYHVGYCESSVIFSLPSDLPDKSEVQWQLIDQQNSNAIICAYNVLVKNAKVTDNIPARYSELIEQNKATIKIQKIS